MSARTIFVFGSNLAGKHAGGAARHAFDQRGAIWGQGEGLQGESYALPTMSAGFQPLPLDQIAGHVTAFLEVARARPELTFQVTAVGCGIAGFTPDQIGPMFEGAPGNCELPGEFVAALEEAREGAPPPQPLPASPGERGYGIVYRPDETNHCPGCGRTHWHVGRSSAECAFCATALPLAEGGMTGSGTFHRPNYDEAA